MENLFYGGITWENYNDNFWEVDHIIPIANADSFDKLVELCHYTNLQPLLILDHKNKTKDK
jgi:hypothetical protein